VERRFILINLYTVSIIALIIGATVLSYKFATKVNWYKTECERLGGIIVHGSGIGLCLKTDVATNE
jgi:hypothetical protein